MLRTTTKVAASLAAASLALAPVAAQANTRAGDNTVVYSTAQLQPGAGRVADGESIQGAGEIIAWLLVGLWATGIVVIVANSDDDNQNQSPGAN